MARLGAFTASFILRCCITLIIILCLIAPSECFSTRPPAQRLSTASDELVGLLLNQQNSQPRSDNDDAWNSHVVDLVDELVDAKVSFDPTECLDGPLYVSHVITGQSPLWQKLGGKRQGQQYTFRKDEKSVINYAEILGKGTHNTRVHCVDSYYLSCKSNK
jgi:hypothetical protein